MNADLVPAVLAASGGAGLVAVVAAHERAREQGMRSSRVRLALRLPLGVSPAQAEAALRSVSGLSYGNELVFELLAEPEKLSFALWVPAEVRQSVMDSLAAALPGMRLHEAKGPEGSVQLASGLFLPTPLVLEHGDAEAASRALQGGLTGLDEGERAVVRWAVRPDTPRRWAPRADDTEAKATERAWRRETSGPGFRLSGLVLVRARTSCRARQLVAHVESVVSSRRGTVGAIRATRGRGSRSFRSMPRTTRTSGWLSVGALAPLLGWPLGDQVLPGVEVGASRELPAPPSVRRDGRRLFVGRDVRGHERPVALAPAAARLHQAVLGPTGSGKSTVIAQGVLDDLAAGQAGLLVDPKNDLVGAVLDRVPERHVDRVVVLDPASRGAAVGLDVFGAGDPDLRAEVLTGVLRGLYAPQGVWGVRSDHYIALALRTLALLKQPSLLLVGRLFRDVTFRRVAVGRLSDPVLRATWATYEELSGSEQREHVQAPLNRVMGLLQRPAVRRVIAQPEPRVNLKRLWDGGGWLLVPTSPGAVGEGAGRVLAAITSFVAWSTLEARAGVPENQRRPVSLVFDELASLSDLPLSLERLAERSRSLGGQLVVGTQALSRLPTSLQDSLLGNVATLISFKSGAREAARIAPELPGLEPKDLQSLGPYEVAARVATGSGTGVEVMTGRTQRLPAPTGMAERIRRQSAARYGVAEDKLEAAFHELLEGAVRPDVSSRTGRARRQP